MGEEIISKAKKGFCLQAENEGRLSLAETDLVDLVQLITDVFHAPFASLSLLKVKVKCLIPG